MRNQLNKDKSRKLFIADYSRGASSALLTASILESSEIDVEGLILFDPVAKYIGSGVQKMPKNVKNSITFVRELDEKIIEKYAGSIDDPGIDGLHGDYYNNPMRPGWGEYYENLLAKCGKEHAFHKVKASHGALGGVGWKHVEEDGPAQAKIACLTNAWFCNLGSTVNIKSLPQITEIRRNNLIKTAIKQAKLSTPAKEYYEVKRSSIPTPRPLKRFKS